MALEVKDAAETLAGRRKHSQVRLRRNSLIIHFPAQDCEEELDKTIIDYIDEISIHARTAAILESPNRWPQEIVQSFQN